MSVTLTPAATLAFQRPLTQLVKQTLTIANPNSSPIAFKVKTTAPKQYCVRPNSGRVEAGESCQVQVLLQPMKEDPAPGTKCRDKFLVQSVIITPEREGSPLVDLWSSVEAEDKAGDKDTPSIRETKIRCLYLPAADDANGSTGQVGSAISTVSEVDESKYDTVRPSNGARDIPSADSTFAPTSPVVPVSAPTTSTPPAAGSPSQLYATPSAPSVISDKIKDVVSGAGVAAAGAGAAVSSAAGYVINHAAPSPTPSSNGSTATTPSAPFTNGDATTLAAQLATAQSEIKRLQAQLSQAEVTAATLRSRGKGEPVSSGGSVPGTAQAVVLEKQEGVPVQIVAGIVVGVFVFTWLFF
ncbi:hypothetical protein P7C70_g1797, partial [Phenoliferia sp. Uapishka_3]